MSLNGALRDLLVADTTVSNLVGKRVHAQHAPHGAKLSRPYVVYQRISGNAWNALDGYSGKKRVRMQIDCYADSLEKARAVANAIRGVLRTAEDAPIRRCLELSDRDVFDDVNDRHGVSMDWAFYIKE